MNKKSRLISMGLCLLVLSLLAGCTSQNKGELLSEEANKAPSEAQTASEGIYPITIEHAFGETVIESEPKRVATIAWANQDVPLALGITPVGISIANYGVTDDSGLLPWTKQAYEALGSQPMTLFNDITGLDFEAINAADPDVILAAYSGITEEEYLLLSEIAPVVAYPRAAWQTYWREQILMDATGMGKVDEGEALVKNIEDEISMAVSNYPAIAGKSAAFFWFNPTDLGKFYIYLPADPRVAYLSDLGMTFPESVLGVAENSDSFAVELSAEQVGILNDVDIIFTYGTETLLDTMQSDALIGSLTAVKNGAVVTIEDGTPLAASCTPSPLSIPETLTAYLEKINAAALKVK